MSAAAVSPLSTSSLATPAASSKTESASHTTRISNDDDNDTTAELPPIFRSDRVKGVELHPTEPWLLTSLHTGSVQIWNTDTQALVRSFHVSTTPVRTARFIARKNWIVTGADDATVRVFNVDSGALVASFKAHDDYVRYIDVHASKPWVLTSGDDRLIKLWDWEREWACVHAFAGHDHYVMQAKFSPSDVDVFASASLDRTLRVWSISRGVTTARLEGHTAGVNCLDFFSSSERRAPGSSSSSALTSPSSFLVSGSDDATVKVWNLATASVAHTLGGHTSNVTAVLKHPSLPLLVSSSEDDSVRTWNAASFCAESVVTFDLCRAWCLSALASSSVVAVGYDHGSVVVDLAGARGVKSGDGAQTARL